MKKTKITESQLSKNTGPTHIHAMAQPQAPPPAPHNYSALADAFPPDLLSYNLSQDALCLQSPPQKTIPRATIWESDTVVCAYRGLTVLLPHLCSCDVELYLPSIIDDANIFLTNFEQFKHRGILLTIIELVRQCACISPFIYDKLVSVPATVWGNLFASIFPSLDRMRKAFPQECCGIPLRYVMHNNMHMVEFPGPLPTSVHHTAPTANWRLNSDGEQMVIVPWDVFLRQVVPRLFHTQLRDSVMNYRETSFFVLEETPFMHFIAERLYTSWQLGVVTNDIEDAWECVLRTSKFEMYRGGMLPEWERRAAMTWTPYFTALMLSIGVCKCIRKTRARHARKRRRVCAQDDSGTGTDALFDDAGHIRLSVLYERSPMCVRKFFEQYLDEFGSDHGDDSPKYEDRTILAHLLWRLPRLVSVLDTYDVNPETCNSADKQLLMASPEMETFVAAYSQFFWRHHDSHVRDKATTISGFYTTEYGQTAELVNLYRKAQLSYRQQRILGLTCSAMKKYCPHLAQNIGVNESGPPILGTTHANQSQRCTDHLRELVPDVSYAVHSPRYFLTQSLSKMVVGTQ